jgi:hypothetical protein
VVPSVATEKIPSMTPPEIDPETVRLVAQCLNHYTTPGPFLYLIIWFLYLVIMFNVSTLKWASNYGQVLVLQKILRTKKNLSSGGESGVVTVSGGVSEIKSIGNHFCRRFWQQLAFTSLFIYQQLMHCKLITFNYFSNAFRLISAPSLWSSWLFLWNIKLTQAFIDSKITQSPHFVMTVEVINSQKMCINCW